MMENNFTNNICVLYNWTTWLCTWNTVSQLYFNKIYIKKKEFAVSERSLFYILIMLYVMCTLVNFSLLSETNKSLWPIISFKNIYYIHHIVHMYNVWILYLLYIFYIVFLSIIYIKHIYKGFYICIYIKSISIDQTLVLVYIQFLNLSTIDIMDQIKYLVWGTSLCIAEHLAVPLVSTN